MLREQWRHPLRLAMHLRTYEATLREELLLIDELVSGFYLARRQFRLFVAWCMVYFAAVTTCERRLLDPTRSGTAYLCADDPALRRLVTSLHGRLAALVTRDRLAAADLGAFEEAVAMAIAPYNSAGLCDASARNMYRHTATV
jgi:FADH2 O2-dependent halogenase